MLYDLIVAQPYRWFRQCKKDVSVGFPPMDFTHDLVKRAIPFRIDDVATHYFNHPQEYVPHDFHYLVPRYPEAWFEFSQPKRGRVGDEWNDYEVYMKDVAGPDFNITKMMRGIYLRSWDRYKEEDRYAFHSYAVKKNVRWLYRAMVFLSIDGFHLSEPHMGISFQVDDRGDIVFFGGPSEPYIFDVPNILVKTVGIDEVKNHVTGSIMPVIMALSLIQCKNVSVQSLPPRREKLGKVGSRRARRNVKKLPRNQSFSEHHIIQITPMTPPAKKGEGSFSGKKKGSLAWHMVPGHFKTYGGIDPETGGPRGKLFGKHEGVYYFPAHERGAPADGTITKEYEVHSE